MKIVEGGWSSIASKEWGCGCMLKARFFVKTSEMRCETGCDRSPSRPLAYLDHTSTQAEL